MNEPEKEAIRQAWGPNVTNIENRLNVIGSQLDRHVAEIIVFPADADEAKLIEDLLSRMRVRFKVA
ncbi:MAG: hypothetical protein K9J37_12200 [Saprospiraceae bacterium]|nr:hypothetical protein [Saprospiraceae bacterium]MCF8250671.1 hypothetical protein [Saprospiraceae bacterium]MCF8280809.1 hypothetical protein [Bacteroidales bacterium]MCF8312523.1 hypothetical protein [Saprospiraceae bacterium]MCF8440797.1 hypothetical protein [Saprospiraceae bacterium]